MALPTCKVAAEIQIQVRFPIGKEKKKSKKQSLDTACVQCGLMFFFCIPADLQGGLATDESARSVGMSPALGTSTGAGGEEQWGWLLGHCFELKSGAFL